jgi:hypothetical protein
VTGRFDLTSTPFSVTTFPISRSGLQILPRSRTSNAPILYIKLSHDLNIIIKKTADKEKTDHSLEAYLLNMYERCEVAFNPLGTTVQSKQSNKGKKNPANMM